MIAVLLYLGPDLSLSMVPGVFVFESDDSVDTIRGPRRLAESEAITLGSLALAPCQPSLARVEVPAPALPLVLRASPRRLLSSSHRLAPSPREPAPASEDPA